MSQLTTPFFSLHNRHALVTSVPAKGTFKELASISSRDSVAAQSLQCILKGIQLYATNIVYVDMVSNFVQPLIVSHQNRPSIYVNLKGTSKTPQFLEADANIGKIKKGGNVNPFDNQWQHLATIHCIHAILKKSGVRCKIKMISQCLSCSSAYLRASSSNLSFCAICHQWDAFFFRNVFQPYPMHSFCILFFFFTFHLYRARVK